MVLFFRRIPMYLLLKKNQLNPSVDSCATVAEDEASNVEDLFQTSGDFDKVIKYFSFFFFKLF